MMTLKAAASKPWCLASPCQSALFVLVSPSVCVCHPLFPLSLVIFPFSFFLLSKYASCFLRWHFATRVGYWDISENRRATDGKRLCSAMPCVAMASHAVWDCLMIGVNNFVELHHPDNADGNGRRPQQAQSRMPITLRI